MKTNDWIDLICFCIIAFIIAFVSEKLGYSDGYFAGIHETEKVRQEILKRDSLNVLLKESD